MADFNSFFLDHLKKSEKEREKELRKISCKRKKAYLYPGEKLLRKYKYKIWRKKPHRRKVCTDINRDFIKRNYRSRYSWPIGNAPKSVVNKRHSFDSAILPDLSRCQDFQIPDIGTELSGNRNNGNSPFNSSNSCNSPPDRSVVNFASKSLCLKCGPTNSEQNNNSDTFCTCAAENSSRNVDERSKTETSRETEGRCGTLDINCSSDKNIKDTYLENDMEESLETKNVLHNIYSENGKSPISDNENTGEAYIDVEGLDDSGEVKQSEHTGTNSEQVTEVFKNGIVHEKVQYIGSKVKHAQPSTQIAPVKWQQQFMSFLSSATASEEDNGDNKSHHSPRRKRSRKVRQSMCPCCVGTGGHHKKGDKSDSPVKHRKQHSIIRDHRRFIRDMTQLVSLRNKVMAVCKILFPQCVGEVFNYTNPDSEDVDKCVDQMISILHSAHQQFLHNLNTKSEISRSANSRKKFKSVKSVEAGNLKYDQIKSNEFLVSICDPSKPLVINTECENLPYSDVSLSPPTLFCSQSEEVNNSVQEERPSLFSNFLPSENEGIVYAVPFENGIAYPDKTQVLLPGDDTPHNIDFVQNRMGNVQNDNPDSIGCKEHGRITSEADSGIVNDHEMSSPENTDKTTVWTDTNLKSKPSPDSAKTEQTANIFDLFSKYEPSCSKSEDKPQYENKSSHSSQEVKSVENKTPVKTGDRNIFDSLFSMNMETSNSPPKLYQNDDPLCDKEIESFYLPLNKTELENLGSILPLHEETDETKEIFVEVYDPSIILCKKPKICMRSFKEKVSLLLRWLLPEITFEKNFLKNTDNLEYLLDAVILSNQTEAHGS